MERYVNVAVIMGPDGSSPSSPPAKAVAPERNPDDCDVRDESSRVVCETQLLVLIQVKVRIAAIGSSDETPAEHFPSRIRVSSAALWLRQSHKPRDAGAFFCAAALQCSRRRRTHTDFKGLSGILPALLTATHAMSIPIVRVKKCQCSCSICRSSS